MQTTKELWSAVGGLSNASKMPGWSYGIPAAECKVGSILRKRKNTVCSTCYAHRGTYSFGRVQRAQYNRLDILTMDIEAWRLNMTQLLVFKYRKKTGNDRVFRWHDSGDLQDMAHLETIVQIARDIPDLRFWLPTKEYSLTQKWMTQNGAFPRNLVVRVSSPLVGRKVQSIPGTKTSTVGYSRGFQCPASTQDNECGSCRECWNPRRKNVNYKKH